MTIRSRGPRVQLGVTISGYSNQLYGFLSASKIEQLGHVDIQGSGRFASGVMFGVNNPKPPRATKEISGNTNTSFVGSNAIATARQNDWIITFPRLGVPAVTAKTRPVYVSVGGVKYAWRMRMDIYNELGSDRAALGIENVTDNDRVIYGARYPIPPRVVKRRAGSTYATFIDPDALDSLPAGFTVVRAGIYFVDAAPVTPPAGGGGGGAGGGT